MARAKKTQDDDDGMRMTPMRMGPVHRNWLAKKASVLRKHFGLKVSAADVVRKLIDERIAAGDNGESPPESAGAMVTVAPNALLASAEGA